MEKAIAFVSGGIGDQLYHFTQMQALAGVMPNKQIDVACLHPGIMRKILHHCSWAGDVIDVSAARRPAQIFKFLAFAHSLKQARYSHAFIFHRSSSFKGVSVIGKIPHRIGLADGLGDRLLLTHSLSLNGGGERRKCWGHRPFIASIDEYVDERVGHSQWQAQTPILPTSQMKDRITSLYGHLPRPWVVVNLFAQDENRRWAIPHAAAVLEQCHTQFGGSFFINAGPDADSYHQSLLQYAPDLKDFTRLTSAQYMDVQQDIALYHLSDGYLGVDSFTANLALNCDLPSVTLFAKETDQLSYRAVSYPVFPETGEKFSDLPISFICGELAHILPVI